MVERTALDRVVAGSKPAEALSEIPFFSSLHLCRICFFFTCAVSVCVFFFENETHIYRGRAEASKKTSMVCCSATEAVKGVRRPLIACHTLPSGFTGTVASHDGTQLTFTEYTEGEIIRTYAVNAPNHASDVTGGLDTRALVSQFERIADLARDRFPIFSRELGIAVHGGGGTFTVSSRHLEEMRLVSAGDLQVGYLDMVVVGDDGYVNYQSRKSRRFEHSGDISLSGHLLHLVSLARVTGCGRVVLVGYRKKPLFSWNGKIGFFGVLAAGSFNFVRVDFSQAGVGTTATAVVALEFTVDENGSVEFAVPDVPKTAVKDTADAHTLRCDPVVGRVAQARQPPDQPRDPRAAYSLSIQRQVELACFGLPNCWYFGNGGLSSSTLSLPRDGFPVTPFPLPGMDVVGNAVALVGGPCGVDTATLKNMKTVVFHLKGRLDASVVETDREKGVNGVYIVYSDAESITNLDITIASWFAGPRSTIVICVNDVYYMHWCTPWSVVPGTLTMETLHKPWHAFKDLLGVYRRDGHPASGLVNRSDVELVRPDTGGSFVFEGVEQFRDFTGSGHVVDFARSLTQLGFSFTQERLDEIAKAALKCIDSPDPLGEPECLNLSHDLLEQARRVVASTAKRRNADKETQKARSIINALAAQMKRLNTSSKFDKLVGHGENAQKRMLKRDAVENLDFGTLLSRTEEEGGSILLFKAISDVGECVTDVSSADAVVGIDDRATSICCLTAGALLPYNGGKPEICVLLRSGGATMFMVPTFETDDLEDMTVVAWVLKYKRCFASLLGGRVSDEVAASMAAIAFLYQCMRVATCGEHARHVYMMIRAVMLSTRGGSSKPVSEVFSKGRHDSWLDLALASFVVREMAGRAIVPDEAKRNRKGVVTALMRLLSDAFKSEIDNVRKQIVEQKTVHDSNVRLFYKDADLVPVSKMAARPGLAKCVHCGYTEKHLIARSFQYVEKGGAFQAVRAHANVCYRCHPQVRTLTCVLKCAIEGCEAQGPPHQFRSYAGSKGAVCYNVQKHLELAKAARPDVEHHGPTPPKNRPSVEAPEKQRLAPPAYMHAWGLSDDGGVACTVSDHTNEREVHVYDVHARLTQNGVDFHKFQMCCTAVGVRCDELSLQGFVSAFVSAAGSGIEPVFKTVVSNV